jgi:hypothetical protein
MEKFIVEDWSAIQVLKSLKEGEQIVALPIIPNQVVSLKFRDGDKPLNATVRGIHLYTGKKTKYDLGLWLGDGSVDDPERETRIYNVDSEFVTPAR